MPSKTLVLQLDYYTDKTTKKYQLLQQYCKPSVEAYALQHDCEYFCITKKDLHHFSYPAKIQLYKDIFIDGYYSQYDKILFLDLDIFIKSNSPSIFDIQCNHLAGCLATKSRYEFGLNLTKSTLKTNSDNFYLLENASVRPNGGVLLFNRSNIDKSIFAYNEETNLEDEMYLSYKIAYRNLCYTIIPDIWNRRNLFLTKDAYFIHILSNLFDNNGIDNTRHCELSSILERISTHE